MARTNLQQTRLLGYSELNLDAVTSMLIGLLNGRTAIRHVAGVGRTGLDLLRRTGIEIAERTLTYRTEAEARQHALECIERGGRLVWPYPPPPGWFADEDQLVRPDLWRRLNAKARMEDWAPKGYLLKHEILTHEALADFDPGGPVCLKAADDAATGWGYAVFACLDRKAFDSARRWFADHRNSIAAVLVQPFVPVQRCWCAGIAVREDGVLCFGGAEQIFSAPTKQSGSRVDPEHPLPKEAVELAIEVAEAARRVGFRGIAGLDIGLTEDGQLLLFDPNFRFNASTTQLLFHEAASARSGLPVSRSFQLTSGGRLSDLAVRLHGPIDEGWFVPTRFFDAAEHEAAKGGHLITGFVLGTDVEDAEAAMERLSAIVAG